MRQFYTSFYTKNIFSSCCYIKENFKNNETYQSFLQDNVTLIQPMNYKYETFIDEILQCLVDKYVITYQNILSEGMVRLNLVESSYCKIFMPLKGTSSINHFLPKKMFFNSCCYTKK